MVSTASDPHNTHFLKIITKTWSRDSHGLFDYEAQQTKNNLLLINTKVKLVRKRNDVKQMTENANLEIEERELARIRIESDKFYMNSPINFEMLPTENNINDLQNKMWYVIRQDDSNAVNVALNPGMSPNLCSNDIYDIKINDIIKLGRVKYAITEIKLNETLLTIDKNVEKPVFHLICDYQ